MKLKKRISATILLIIFTLNLLAPSSAYARINFRKLFRSIRRGTRFVVNLPSKATKFMGPVLGPIAADLISINLGKNPKFGVFFNKARKLDKIATNIEEQNKVINELKQIYGDQANQLRQKADEIRTIRKALATQLIKGEITRKEHLEQVADLEAIAQIYEDTADKFDRSKNRINPAQIIKILGSDFIKNSILKIRNLIKHEAADELNRFLDPNVIKNIISGSGSLDGILQVLLSDDLDKLKNDKDFDFERFKDQLLEKIKQMIKQDKDTLKGNWQQKMQELIQAQIKENKLPDAPTPKPDPTSTSEDDGTELDELLDFEDDGCDPGYVFHPRSGVGCVQQDCYKGKIPNAHLSYTGRCICGSSGSVNENPEDPNQECSYDKSNRSCPSCVYACIHLDEDCPEK